MEPACVHHTAAVLLSGLTLSAAPASAANPARQDSFIVMAAALPFFTGACISDHTASTTKATSITDTGVNERGFRPS